MSVIIVLIDFIDCFMSASRLVVDTFVFFPAREKYKEHLQIVSQMLEEHLFYANLYQNNFDCVISENEVFKDPITIEAVKD